MKNHKKGVSEVPHSFIQAKTIESKMTYSHLLPGSDVKITGIQNKNIGRTFSPDSSEDNLPFLITGQKPITQVADLKDMNYKMSIKSTMGDSASDVIQPQHDIIGIDWDEKLAEAGYGHDVMSEASICASTRSSTMPPWTGPAEGSILSDALTYDLSNILFQDIEDTATLRKESDIISITKQKRPTVVSIISPDSVEKLFDEYEMSDDHITNIMRKATEFQCRTSVNVLDFLRAKRSMTGIDSKTIGWDKSNIGSTAGLERELGIFELENIMKLRDVTMMGSCIKNNDGTRDLFLNGAELQQRIGRRIGDNDIPRIFQFITENPDIIYLDLSYNNITSDGLHQIMHYISKNNTLFGLNLMCNDIKEISSKDIINFTLNTSIKSFRINGNFIERKGGELISFMIMYKNLKHLDISQTDQSILTVPWLIQAILQSDLQVLDMSRILGHPIYTEYTQHCATLFGDLLKRSFTLVELHIEKNSLTDHDMIQLMDGFWKNKTLEMLNLSCNKISDYGAEIISQFINHGAPLKALMLSHNQIGDTGARALSFKIPFSQLKLLDLSHNRIKNISDIIYTVQKPPLLALFIFGNIIDEKTSKSIYKKINNGLLNPDSIDIRVELIGDEILIAHNQSADRYRNRYYNVPRYGYFQLYKIRRQIKEKCLKNDDCLDYIYHNVINGQVETVLKKDFKTKLQDMHKKNFKKDLEPSKTIKGTCLI